MKWKRKGTVVFPLGFVLVVAGCSNSPYPGVNGEHETVMYTSFRDPPKDLDPQRAYTVADNTFLSLCYEGLLTFDYLSRPLTLIPELALSVPDPAVVLDEKGNESGVRYVFDLQPGVHYIDDPCFPGGKGRLMTALDFEFAFKRLADPETSCPVVASFRHIRGFLPYRERLEALREEMIDAAVASGTPEKEVRLSLVELYDRAGTLAGVTPLDNHRLEIILDRPYPQILYWLAMRFCSAIPWEAVEYYNGQFGVADGVEPMEFQMRPVGTGPYMFEWSEYNREAKIVLVRNDGWWGFLYPDRKAETTIFPLEPGEPSDVERGIWTPEDAGRQLGQVHRLEWYLEKETLSRFNKFLQGYYDASGIPLESFNQVIEDEGLTPEMEAKGIQLVKDYGLDVFYLGFNMQDDVIGAPLKFKDPALEKNRIEELGRRRKLRQAMSLAIDTREYLRIFANNLGVPAQSPLPPGLFGYDEEYRNPYRQYDPGLEKAKELLRDAGYENGINPLTGEPLKLTYDAGSTDTRARAVYNFYIDSWKKLGIDVELAATSYNKFQEKMYSGNFQLFSWGWIADYPDPENFMFLLYGPNSGRHDGHNPNHAWYENETYDFYFGKMETLPDDGVANWMETDEETGQTREISMTRHELIRKLISIVEWDCPWIPNMHSEGYVLYHAWLRHAKPHPISGSRAKYLVIDKDSRAKQRVSWNQPVRWPAYVVVAILVLFLLPAIRAARKERR